MKLFIFLLFYFFTSNILLSQYSCLNNKQLIRITTKNLNDVKSFLYNENWTFNDYQENNTSKYFKYELEYELYSWNKYSNGSNVVVQLYKNPDKSNIVILDADESCFISLLTEIALKLPIKTFESEEYTTRTCSEGKLTIEFRKYKNSDLYSVLYYNAPSLNAEILKVKKIEQERKSKIEQVYSEVEKLKTENKYDEAIIKYESVISIALIEDNIENKIELLKKEQCDYFVEQGDEYYNAQNYEIAIEKYNLAKHCDDDLYTISNRINKSRARIKEIKVSQKMAEATIYLENKNFNSALNSYKEITLLDPNNYIAINKIDEINSILEVIEIRKKTIFSYRETNYNDYYKITKNLSNELNSISKLNFSGALSFQYKIAFDTSGNNISKYNITNSTIPTVSTYLNSLQSTKLSTPSLKGYYIASKEDIIINYNWNSDYIKFNSKSSKIKQISGENVESTVIKDFINRQKYNYGKFTFELKNKTLNGENYTDINLVKQKTAAGPLCMFYSMILPGVGTLKVTHGEKGWGRMTCFILSTGLGILCNSLSNLEYNQYLTATNKNSSDTHYNAANVYINSAIICYGVSASIYLYDMFYVFTNGWKNIYQSREIRRSLRRGPINIKSEEVSVFN
jgi:hypothetical protein